MPQKKTTSPTHKRTASKTSAASPAGAYAVETSYSDKHRMIMAAAEKMFAVHGFDGVSLDTIAQASGMSKHNLLYYFSSKDNLYIAVLDSVIERWLECMRTFGSSDDPQEAVLAYITAKLRFSQEHASGSLVFTREISAGAPRYAHRLQSDVLPLLQQDVKTLEKWARQKRIRKVNFTHLMFMIWSCTQAYADLAPQFALFLGKPALENGDFAQAQTLLYHMVWSALAPDKRKESAH